MRRFRAGGRGRCTARRFDPRDAPSFFTRARQYNNSNECTSGTMTKIVVVLTTMPDDETRTDELARTLVDERLAACVSVYGPMTSTYRWKGGVERDVERQVVIKTTADRLDALRRRLPA